MFKINPKNEIFLYGVVINNHINNINGDDLLLYPEIVGKDKFVNEYGEEIVESQILGRYSVVTDTGIARMINRELIIAGII